MIYVVFALVMSLIPENELLIMAESTLSTEIELYQFELMTVACYSDEDSNSDESDTDVWEQVSFTEHLGKVNWCSCLRCIPMPHGIECKCCREMDAVHERLVEQEEINCITIHDQFSIVCLNKNVLYTVYSVGDDEQRKVWTPAAAFVKQARMMLISVNENLIHECIIVVRAYRLAAFRQFIHWTYSRLGTGIRKVCVVAAVRPWVSRSRWYLYWF